MLKLLLASILMFCIVVTPIAAAKNDASIAAAVQSKLASNSATKSANIHVTCKNGVVTLSGVVPNNQAVAVAGQVAGSVAGVKSVVNRVVSGTIKKVGGGGSE